MKRLVLSIVFYGLFTTAYGQSVRGGKLSKSERKPNFIQILTDDQGWGDLGSFGHKFIKTPNIDQLAKEGVKLVQCYSSAAVCSPSRSSILTGRTPFRNGVFRWVPADHFCHLQKDEVTLPQLLRKNGYQTTHFGKWHLSNYTEKKQGESKWPQPYSDFGFGTDPNQPSMDDYGYDYWFATGNVARPSHETTVVIPFKEGDESELGEKVNDAYFGKISKDYLQTKEDVLFLKGDGTKRGKIGVGPKRTKGIAGSYDANGGVLNLVTYNEQEAENGYVNSAWEEQEEPYSGDVLNAYNDGSPEPGVPAMGPFYELETSSPAAALKPNETMTHIQTTIHLQGDEEELNRIAIEILGVSLNEIITVF